VKKYLFFLFILPLQYLNAQIKPAIEYGGLFTEVELQRIFPDSKTFPDCIPKQAPQQIMEDYRKQKDKQDFSLKSFVYQNFDLPPVYDTTYQTNRKEKIVEHIENLWDVLKRTPQTITTTSLIPLPNAYIVPGGRFREIYYWDSYFTMLGLVKSHRGNLAGNMLDNFAYLLDTYGFIPNGNRTYYLSRSQPPFFSLMVDLLADYKGMVIYKTYLPQLLKEYSFWMNGIAELKKSKAYRRLVKMPDGEILNRYWDDLPKPRPESYYEDVTLAQSTNRPPKELYRNLRAACESGWDFSSRWLKDPNNLASIRTTEIIPVDLNALLYHLETTLAKAFRENGDSTKAKDMLYKAACRKKALLKYCWSPQDCFFTDYDWVGQKSTRLRSLAGIYPLFFQIPEPAKAKKIASVLEKYFLCAGGVATTLVTTGQQWDYPNGWAPLQYLTIAGLEKYGSTKLADTIKNRWLALNEKVFYKTGKMMEKYDVSNLNTEAGGGEYSGQDGFGWTNGVYLMLKGNIGK